MNKFSDYLNDIFKKFSSPAFLVLLGVSFVFWFLTKLNYTYTTDIPVDIEVDGVEFRVQCVAEGRGYNLFAHKFYDRSHIKLRLNDLRTTPSPDTPGALIVDPVVLQSLIAARCGDVRILSVGEIPELTVYRAEP